MSMDIKAALKKPWVKYGLIAVGFFGVFYILYTRESGSSSSSTTSSGESDAQYAADEQYAQAQLAASASSASQTSAQNFQLASQQESDTTNLAALKETDATNISLANVQLSGLQAQLNQATQSAQIVANTQMHISDNQTSVSLAQVQGATSVANTSSNNAVKSSTIGVVGGLVTGALAAFF